MSERDELLGEIADATDEWDAIQNSVTRETWEGTQDEHLADWLIERGYRKVTVTQQQGESVAAVMAYRSTQVEMSRMEEVDKRYWRARATEVLDQLGLSVAGR